MQYPLPGLFPHRTPVSCASPPTTWSCDSVPQACPRPATGPGTLGDPGAKLLGPTYSPQAGPRAPQDPRPQEWWRCRGAGTLCSRPVLNTGQEQEGTGWSHLWGGMTWALRQLGCCLLGAPSPGGACCGLSPPVARPPVGGTPAEPGAVCCCWGSSGWPPGVILKRGGKSVEWAGHSPGHRVQGQVRAVWPQGDRARWREAGWTDRRLWGPGGGPRFQGRGGGCGSQDHQPGSRLLSGGSSQLGLPPGKWRGLGWLPTRPFILAGASPSSQTFQGPGHG